MKNVNLNIFNPNLNCNKYKLKLLDENNNLLFSKEILKKYSLLLKENSFYILKINPINNPSLSLKYVIYLGNNNYNLDINFNLFYAIKINDTLTLIILTDENYIGLPIWKGEIYFG